MTNEHMGTCIYEKGRFELRETDNAIIDLKGDFPPIIIASNTVDDGSEPNCADRRSVLHLLNELADNNPNEERHWYLKKMLDKSWTQYHELKEENEQLKQSLENKMNSDNYWEQKATEKIKELRDENEQLKKELKEKTKWIRRSLESVRPIIKNGKQEIEKTNSTTLETLYNTLGDIPISYHDFEIMFCIGTKAYPVDELFINENKMVIALYKGDVE